MRESHSEQRADTLCHFDGMNVRDGRLHNYPPRWNAAISLLSGAIIRPARCRSTLCAGVSFRTCQDPKDGRKPINAKCETVRSLPTFRDAYRRRRCILPVDGFFEWKAIKAKKLNGPTPSRAQMAACSASAALWENWKEPASGEWIHTFAIITTDANELVVDIFERYRHLRSWVWFAAESTKRNVSIF
jgi:putative SOS response-associated peptidase YedK